MGGRGSGVILALLLMQSLLFAQLDRTALVTASGPDFGGLAGGWGHLQYHRPYGIKAIVMRDWRDLTTIAPISGEPLNTDRQGWIPIEAHATLWQQMHPSLTSPADTTAASLLVNYKQGDGELKDFNLWYHNSMGEVTRYGWFSKLRSHPRILGATVYDEQRHRFQILTEPENYTFKAEVGYTNQLNPLYTIELDTTTFFWSYDNTPQFRSDRWDGNVEWNNLDSNQVGQELFAWVQSGLWKWPVGERQSLNALAYVGHHFKVGQMESFKIKLGVVSKRFGGIALHRQLFEFDLPKLSWNQFELRLGIKSLGKSPILPLIDLSYRGGPVTLKYETLDLIEDRTWQSRQEETTLNHLSTGLAYEHMGFSVEGWQGTRRDSAISGFGIHGYLNLPWSMQARISAAALSQPLDWVFSERYVSWELDQELTLFKNALHGQLKIWGKHLFETHPGRLDSETLDVSESLYQSGVKVLNLLNYTISGQVSSVIISFTDQNILQDQTWTQYKQVTWDEQYTLMENQISESRFRYLTIIWVFDN